MREMDEDVEVHMQAGRFECVRPGSLTQGFVVAVTRTHAHEPATVDRMTVFRPSDVFKVRRCISGLSEKVERMLLESCFGIFAYTSYVFVAPGTGTGFQILMTIARTSDIDTYLLTMGDHVSVPFKALGELQAMLPPFSAEGESGYEKARFDIIAQFLDALD